MLVVETGVELPVPIAHSAPDKRACTGQYPLWVSRSDPHVPQTLRYQQGGQRTTQEHLVQGHRGPSSLPPRMCQQRSLHAGVRNPQPLKSLIHPRGRQQTQESHGQGHREVSSVVPLLVWDSGRSRREPSAASLRAPGGGSEHHSTPSRGGAQECQRITPEPHGHDHYGPARILG